MKSNNNAFSFSFAVVAFPVCKFCFKFWIFLKWNLFSILACQLAKNKRDREIDWSCFICRFAFFSCFVIAG